MAKERGSINGIPFWIDTLEVTLGERTILKQSPLVDGGVVETQGQAPERISLSFTIAQDGDHVIDDVETTTLDFRAMLLQGGPFTLDVPTLGEVTDLWMEGAATLSFFDEARENINAGTITLVSAELRLALQESASLVIDEGWAALSRASVIDFGERAPEIGLSPAAVTVLELYIDWMTETKAKISNAFQPVNDLTAEIAFVSQNLEALAQAPENLASRLNGLAVNLLGLVPALAQQGDADLGSAAIRDPTTDKASELYRDILDAGLIFDSTRPPTQAEVLGDEASAFDLEEQDEVNSATALALTGICASVAEASASTVYVTLQGVVALSESLAPAFDRLLNLERLAYDAYSSARLVWKACLEDLRNRASTAPRLFDRTTTQDIDILTLVDRIYGAQLRSEDDVQLAVESVIAINDLEFITHLPRGTQIRYLDPLVVG